MTFYITIIHDRQTYRYKVEQLPSDESFDYFKIIAGNGFMILKSNAPIMKRHNLKSRRPKWEVHQHPLWNSHFREAIIKEIEKVIK